ncbi:polymer-forming cytoskeletal protein, partial [Eikenella sp. S3360]
MFKDKKDRSQPVGSSTPSAIDTIIGAQCRIQGDILSQQSVKIEGQIQGNVQAGGTVIIGDKGSVNGDIRGSELVVFGKTEGLIEVKKLHLKPNARVTGNIRTQSLQVEDGAVYTGDIRMDRNAGNATLPPAGSPEKA